MEWFADQPLAVTLALSVGTLLVLLALGMEIGLALLAVGFLDIALFSSRPAGDAMATTIWSSLTAWPLIPLPLFIWMGEILYESRVAAALFGALAPWLERVPGRLLQVNVAACGIFAAISGSSAATCATIGRITLPELRRRDYPERMAVGTLAGSATLGLLMPPSIIMIVYGVAADVSISKLFVAGIVPALALTAILMGYVAAWAFLHRDRIPREGERIRGRELLRRSLQIVPPVLLIVFVLGSIYAGYATPTQSAALGVAGALAIAFARGGFGWDGFRRSLRSAARTSSMVLLILAGSSCLSLAMGFTGIPRELAAWVGGMGLSQAELLLALTALFLLMGCFLDGISLVLLTMAVLLPVITQAGFDLLWFGIYIVIVTEIAQITPPVGFNLFVIQGLAKRDIGFVSRAAAMPFLLILSTLWLIYAFPGLVTWLPETMAGR